MAKFTVNYFPENLSHKQMTEIRDAIKPSLHWDDSCQYQTDEILEIFWHDEWIVDACEWCDYLEF